MTHIEKLEFELTESIARGDDPKWIAFHRRALRDAQKYFADPDYGRQPLTLGEAMTGSCIDD